MKVYPSALPLPVKVFTGKGVLLLEAEASGNGHHPAVLAHYCSWPVQCRHEETGVSKMAAVCVRAEVQTALFMLLRYTS